MTEETNRAADDVLDAFALAQSVATLPQQLSVADSVRLASALLRLRELMARRESFALVPGSRLRLSTQLLRDVHAMPAHESCTVRLVRIEVGADGVGVIVVQPIEDEHVS